LHGETTAELLRRNLRAPRRPEAAAAEVTMSSVVRDRMNRTLRRRLSDRVMDVFQEACVAGDLATAEELLAVMQAMYERRQTAVGDRRLSQQDLENARDGLAIRKADRAAPKAMAEAAD
jgi:hypothetical protein